MVTEPTMVDGAWAFPDGWPEPARVAWVDLQASIAAAEDERAAAEDERAAAMASPEGALLAARAKADAARTAAARAKVEAEDERALLDVRAKYGERVVVIYTAAGSLACVWTRGHERLWASAKARADTASQAFLEASPPDPIRAQSEYFKALHEGYFEHVIVYPARDRAREILETYPETWAEVYAARQDLARGPRAAAGKGAGR